MNDPHNTSDILIIAIGNEFRSDDAVGLIVGQQIAQRQLPGVTVIERSGEGTSLMEAWMNAGSVILIDAVASGSPPGTIHFLDAAREIVPAKFFHYSTHAFGVAEAIEMARTLGQLPPGLIVFGIEGKNFAAGTSLSPEVREAANSVVKKILTKLEA